MRLAQPFRKVMLVASLLLVLVSSQGHVLGFADSIEIRLMPRRQIVFPEVEPLHYELRWLMAQPVSILNSATAAVLIPLPQEQDLRRRPASGKAERRFALQLVDLHTGEIRVSRELTFRLGENLGLAVSASGKHLCTIRSGEVLILDAQLSAVASLSGVAMLTPDAPMEAFRCAFFADESKILLLHRAARPVERRQKFASLLSVWKWPSKELQRSLQFKEFVWDTKPLPGEALVLLDIERGLRYRHRLTRIDLDKAERPKWAKEIFENGGQRLLVGETRVFRGEWEEYVPRDVAYFSYREPSPFDPRPTLTELPSPSIIGRIRSWWIDSGKKAGEFSLRSFDLMWPVDVSADERLLVARAVHFSYTDDTWQHRWDDNRFVVFDTSKPKKPLTISENFGPEEAVTGLAFTPDRKTLVVATSRRLLIYDVQEGPAK